MPEQVIIALSGRKGSGKNTLASYIKDYYFERFVRPTMVVLALPPDSLLVAEAVEKAKNHKIFECSFADKLKEFCVETLGLSREACYGSEEQKNASTQYRWEDVGDLFLRWRFSKMDFVCDGRTQKTVSVLAHPDYLKSREYFWERVSWKWEPSLKTGPMSGRDIMQLFGTDLIRQTFGNVWAAATIREIKKQGKSLSVITDNRFPNEIETVLQEPKGFIVRLTRSPYGYGDAHPSEASLDNFNWDRDRCFVLNNAGMTIEEQNAATKPLLDVIFKEHNPTF